MIGRRRRRRRRLSLPALALLAAVVVVVAGLAAVVGGVLRARSQSDTYRRAVDRSFALEVRAIVSSSDALDRRFRSLVAVMPGEARPSLEADLDTLVRSSASLARAAWTAASPAPWGGAGADVAAAMAARARAMADLRTLVDRLIGMGPLAVVGSPDPTSSPAPPPPLGTEGAAAALGQVSDLLAKADREYAAAREELRKGPGAARIPPSVWSGRLDAWTPGAALAFVDSLAGSPSLAAVHRIELVTDALALTPAPVPSAAPGPASATQPGTVVPPTGRLQLTAVVANDGNVAERDVVVETSLRPATAGTRAVRRRTVAIGAGESVSVAMPAFAVVPGRHYSVTVSVQPAVPNAPEAAGVVTTDTLTAAIAAPAPPIVSQLLPAKARTGADVTIFGSGFTWVSAVDFGALGARFTVISSTQITAIVPAGSATASAVAVRVVNPGGPSALGPADRFTYRVR